MSEDPLLPLPPPSPPREDPAPERPAPDDPVIGPRAPDPIDTSRSTDGLGSWRSSPAGAARSRRRPAPLIPSDPTSPAGGSFPTADGTVRFGLWGSPRSGKSTFLGALRLAAMGTSGEYGNWIVTGADQAASEFLVDQSRLLVNERVFPSASTALRPMSWRFQGNLRGTRFARRGLLGRKASNVVEFTIELQDLPGRYFGDTASAGAADAADPAGTASDALPHREEIVSHLAASSGLVYLFDPVRETDRGDSFAYFQGVLEQVARKAYELRRFEDGRLPHHVAVTVTKFDDPQLFTRALEGGWVTQDEHGRCFPRVPDQLAKGFFEWLCDEEPDGTAEYVRSAIQTYFHPNRVAYFVSSAVGFRTGPDGVFDPDDYANVNMIDKRAVIRGKVHPINVLEPLIKLERAIRTGAW